MIRRPPRSTLSPSSAASDVYKRQWEWCPPIEKGNKSSFGMVFAEMNFEDGIFEPDEEYTSDYEIGISLNFASIMEE